MPYRTLSVILLVLAISVWEGRHHVDAAEKSRYAYGVSWWQELRPDGNTMLLLHFGKPQVSSRKKLVTALEKKKAEDIPDLDEMDMNGDTVDADIPIQKMTIDEFKQKPVDDSNVPADVVLDYSKHRQKFKLGPGVKKVPGGRFGQGLQFEGTGALKIQLPGSCRAGVECSFKIAAYPKETACLFSIAGGESRLLLRPDGKLEFKLRKPHGNPGVNPNISGPMTEQQKKIIFAKDASIVSPEPVPLNEWVHVLVYDKPHPTPGGGEPWDARLSVNGKDVAWYLSERYNDYRFMGWKSCQLIIGNNEKGDMGFRGVIDEVRVNHKHRTYYQRPPLPWRDPAARRPLEFNKPFFREDGTIFHAGLEKGLQYDINTAKAEPISIDLKGETVEGLQVPGIRGKGWVIDPLIGYPRFPLKGMRALEGGIEFWLRPVNWDDVTGYWHHTPPPNKHLSVARFYGKDKQTGKTVQFMNLALERAHNIERGRVPIGPGHWMHMTLVWNHNAKEDAKKTYAALYRNGKRAGGVRMAGLETLKNVEPLYVEFGVRDDVKAKYGEKPRIEIDEVVGYDWSLRADEVAQAQNRWKGKLEPIKLYNDKFTFKWSLQKLEYFLTPLPPAGVKPGQLTVSLVDAKTKKVVLGPFSEKYDNKPWHIVMNEEKALPYGAYRFQIELADAQGQSIVSSQRDWQYKEDPWRHNRAGIIEKTPPPWTPIRVSDNAVEMRMTKYVLGENGLPAEIHADGVNIMAGPIQLLENGQPMTGKIVEREPSKDVEANWKSLFTGKTCDIEMRCHAEYDGMIKYTLAIRPKGKVAPIAFVMPVKAEHATHYLQYPLGARGPKVGTIDPKQTQIFESRVGTPGYREWKAYKKEKKSKPDLTWEDYWTPIAEKRRRYAFVAHADINDRNRGLWWFCDNGAGWWQSKRVSAFEIKRIDNAVAMVLNLVAEETDYKSDRPIVFAILPHPARPLPKEYRQFDRVSPKKDPVACDIYDAFFPWPQSPKAGNMTVFPASDPKNKEAGPSWAYAESCIPSMKASKPVGTRTLYLSKIWFSCRAGAYDGWEWRNGPSGQVTLTPWFVNYLCWEMDEWIGRNIWDAIYLDECYEITGNNLENGLSIRLPDGSVQNGVDNFQFRELIKRWRNIFHQHGRRPVMIAHHTNSWQYHVLVYFDSYLDGENTPIVSLNSRDWIDSVALKKYETINNCRLWGLSPFWMPFVAEGGFGDKEASQYPKWQWRMARQANSQFAQFEIATVYEGQGAFVYDRYWDSVLKWGAGDASAPFRPYWKNSKYISVNAPAKDVQVGFYHKKDGSLLLIASNRTKQKRDIKVTLNRDALGLPANAKVRQFDPTFNPPPGPDYMKKAAANKEAMQERDKQLENALGLEEEEEELDLGALEDELMTDKEKKAQVSEEWSPRLEGDILVLPTRPRDYRVVILE